jgi:N-dimethylarginine dimethylaminohydrolase
MKKKVGGKWWIKGQEHNDQLIDYVETWLGDWVGYCEETVFEVNMLSINEECVIVNNYNKKVFDFLAKHNIEPIVCSQRHRWFWDGGVHCLTQDLYREGEQIDYLTQ